MTRLERLVKQAREMAWDDVGERDRRGRDEVVLEVGQLHRVGLTDVEETQVWIAYREAFDVLAATYKEGVS